MAKKLSIAYVLNDDEQPFEAGAKEKSLRQLNNLNMGLLGGARTGAVTVTARQSEVAATGTLTLATCLADTVVEINGVDFIAKGSAATAGNNEFDISGGTDTLDATALKNAINASTSTGIANVVTATSDAAVVTLTSSRAGALGNSLSLKTGGVRANGTATCAAVDNASDTLTLNGTVLSATQHNASATATFVTAVVGNTITLNGNTFTAVAGAAVAGANTFSIDTGDTETATSFAAQVNACTDKRITGLFTATSAAGVTKVRAVVAGTAANSYAIAKVGAPITLSAATLAAGAAVANNQFDATGSNAETATALAACINASSTALVNKHCKALARAAVVYIYAKYPGTAGNMITLASSDGTDLAVSAARLAGGTLASSEGVAASATVTCAAVAAADTVTINGQAITAHATVEADNQFSVAGTDSADATSLAKAINDSPTASVQEVIAVETAAAVLISARRGGVSGNAITIATSNGSRLAITGDASGRLANGAVPTTVVASGDRLASGSETLLTAFSF